MLAAPAEEFDPTLPGLFAGDPPAEFVPLLEEIAADVRPDTLRTQLLVMAEADQRDVLPRIVSADPAGLGRARRALAAQRRPPVRASDSGRDACGDPRRRPRQPARTARPGQRRRTRVLQRPRATLDLKTSRSPPGAALRGGIDGASATVGKRRRQAGCRSRSEQKPAELAPSDASDESEQWRGRLLNARFRSRGSAVGRCGGRGLAERVGGLGGRVASARARACRSAEIRVRDRHR